MSTICTVSSKGQMTLPVALRKAWRIGVKGGKVRFELREDGSVQLYPMRDALSLQGAFADPSRPYDPLETEKAFAMKQRKEWINQILSGKGTLELSGFDAAQSVDRQKDNAHARRRRE